MPHLLLNAYFDASNQTLDPDTAVMFVSGCVAADQKWKRFEVQWLKLLEENGISRPFRMSKFWADFRDRPEDRSRIASDAIQLIKRNVRKTFSSGVELKAYERLRDQRDLPALIDNPYTLCASKAVYRVGEWIKRRDINGKIGFLFEEGDLGQPLFGSALEDVTGVRVEFVSKRDASPFDAGDLIAWVHSRSYSRYLGDRANDIQPLLLELARKLPGAEEWGVHDQAWFDEHGPRWPGRSDGSALKAGNDS